MPDWAWLFIAGLFNPIAWLVLAWAVRARHVKRMWDGLEAQRDK